MLRYAIIRTLWLIPIIICVSFIIYALMDMAPGTVIDNMITSNMTEDDVQTLREMYNLDKPMIYRFGLYMLGLVQGDLGRCEITGLPVWDTYMARFPKTLELSLWSLVFGVALAIPLGILAAKYAGTIWDNLITMFSLIGLSMPGFWLGLLLLLWFASDAGIKVFPVGFDGTWKSYVLPVIATSLVMAATTTRQTRSAILDVSRQDYLRTARAKGVPEQQVTSKHALRNAWIPIITTIGITLSRVLAGSAIIEAVFTWPGVGRLTVEAVSQRNATLAAGCVILTSILYVLLLLLVDIMYALVDPRIRDQYSPLRRRRRSST